MKITFVLPANLLNGGIRVIGIVAGELRDRGHDIHLVLQPHRCPRLKRQLRSLRDTGRLLPRSQDGPFLDALRDDIVVLAKPRPVVDADLPDADVIVATWWETAHWVAGVSASKGAKVYFMQDYGAPGQELEKISETFSLPFAFITLTELLRSMILEENPLADVAIMRNAVDTELFDAPPRPRGHPPRVGLIYRSGKASKGMDTARAALERIRKMRPDVRVTAVCASPAVLPDWIDVVLKPDDQKLVDAYRSCDLWLFPSRMEGFGLPILEAMACGTPVISTKVGGAPDVISSGKNGVLVDIGDDEGMARHAVALLNGPEKAWREMSQAARETVRSYGWSDAVDVFEDALQRAAKNP